MRLRLGSATTRHDSLYSAVLPIANRVCLLFDVCECAHCCYWAQGCVRDGTCMPQPLSIVCSHATAQGSGAIAWRHLFRNTGYDWPPTRQVGRASFDTNSLCAAQGKILCANYGSSKFTRNSPSHCLFVQCSSPTSTSAIAYANTTSHQVFCCVLSRVNLSRLYTAATCIAFSTACYQQGGLA